MLALWPVPTPRLARVAHQEQLVLLGALGDGVTWSRRGETALRGQRELFEREDATRLADTGGQPVGRIAGPKAMQVEGWQRLHAEYAEQLGVEMPSWKS